MKKIITSLSLIVLVLASLSGCRVKMDDSSQEGTGMVGEGKDATYEKKDGQEVIYLAGGCFWGMEKLTSLLPGVIDATNGYANGQGSDPSYEEVCTGGTGFKETVRVTYDPEVITLPQIIQAYFLVIDPTLKDQQGNDKGSQYQTGIYYNDKESAQVVEEIIAKIAKKYPSFQTEHQALINFYDAESYHQDYLEKNTYGYCHIPNNEIDQVVALIKAEESYAKPDQAELKNKLTNEQYEVTQNAATERAFSGEYWDTTAEGIYVDVTTGQPLFLSLDKYLSSCGWPSFSAPIYEGIVRYSTDTSHSMTRTEVTSDLSGAHLGHVFEDDPESPNGTRFCINSASLTFIPKAQMTPKGYGAYLILFKE